MIKFVFLTWGAMLVSSLLGVVDTAFLSFYTDDNSSFSIFGSSYIIHFFVTQFFIGFAIYCNRNASRNKKFNIPIFFSVILFSIILVFILVRYFPTIHNSLFPNISQERSFEFIKPIFYTIPFLIMIFACAGFFRGINKPLIPVIASISVLLLNFILNYTFIKMSYSDTVESCISWATFYADFIVSFIYFLLFFYFLIKNDYLDFIISRKSIKEIFFMGCEKVFSNGSLIVSQSFFASKISNDFFSSYVVYEKFFIPFFLFAHAIHEGLICHKSNKNPIKIVCKLTLILSFIIYIFFSYLFELRFVTINYYMLSLFYFLILSTVSERAIVALLYKKDMEKSSMKVISTFKISQFLTFSILTYLNYLNESTFFIVLFFSFLLEICFLILLYIKEGETKPFFMSERL